MALNMKLLNGFNLPEDVKSAILEAHLENVNGLKADRDQYRTDAEKYAETKAELDRIKAEAAKNGGKNPYQVKYEALKEEFDKYKSDTETKATKAKKESAYRKLLKDAGVTEKRIDAVLRVSDFDGIEFDGDGKIKDVDKLTESIKKEWADFIPQQSQQGAPSQNPPSTTTGKTMTKDEIMKITDTAARQKAIAENHELFGI